MQRRFAAILLPMWAAAGLAVAADGVYEINQACATGPGCFPGDDPGFPVTINSSGSYVLTGNLGLNNVLGPPSVNLIQVSGNDVHLDLNGFALRCSNLLTGDPCGAGSSSAILLANPTPNRVSIRNGSIFGMPQHGIVAVNSAELHIENLFVSFSGEMGINSGWRSRIEGCTVTDNGDRGISAGFGSIIARNVVRNNGDDGIWVGESSLVRDNLLDDNAGIGIRAGGDSIVVSNVASDNQVGLSLSSTQDGGGLARDNTANANSGLGMSMSSDWVFTGNIVQNNNGGNANPQTNGGIEGPSNYCGTTAGCP